MGKPSDKITSPSSSTQVACTDVQNSSRDQKRDSRKNAATGASAAGVRAVGSQMIAFYFRAPAKAFFRTRVDYLAFARAINPRVQANASWSWRTSTPGLLTYAIRVYGWSFIPNQILPPMLANIGVGAVLYTSYLQILGSLHHPSSQSLKRVYPPPPAFHTFIAGFSAGAVQSIVAAPIDALQVRFRTSDILDGKYKNMWQYGRKKLVEIGPRGVFAGWELSLVKDSLSCGIFFATFEYVKAQSYYAFVAKYYGRFDAYKRSVVAPNAKSDNGFPIIKPHYAIEPTFLMLAGITASIAQQVVLHPITLVQAIHYETLARLQKQAVSNESNPQPLRTSYTGYQKTYQRCLTFARRFGGWRRWLYRGFLLNTIKQVPSTSAGLVIFELVRRRYGSEVEAVRIEKDGYDILLT
ncbi:hypothetical protein MMC07_006404 [Pseudocyphellaria aurata]|nr:hypothetical protein [Pseudocyphellaria aurata]